MSYPDMWPFAGDAAPKGRHRLIHIWSTGWLRDGKPVTWTEAQELRRLARDASQVSFGDVFDGQLERQYRRVADRVPRLAGEPEPISVEHRLPDQEPVTMHGHCFLAALASGHLLACVNVLHEGALERLPSLLIDALRAGPELLLRADGRSERLADYVDRSLPWLADRDFELELASEMHTMVFASPDDEPLWSGGNRNDELVRRLVGRLPDEADCVLDKSIQWPNEFNKLSGTIGAIRPGASLILRSDAPAARNALISTLLLMGSASLLREARDEVYAVQTATREEIRATNLHLDFRGLLAEELTRLARVEIAVAFDVESHLDMRRLISDAMLVQWHACLAEALAIPNSVTALHDMASHLSAAMKTVSDRTTATNAILLSALAAILAAIALFA